MRVRRSAPSWLIGTVVIILCATGIISHRLSLGLIDSVEESRFDLMRSILSSALADTEGKALARAEMVAALPSVAARLRAGDRPGMLAEMQQLFAEQRDRFGVSQAQFLLPPTTSFLRLNAPEKFGDDVSSFRPMIVEWQRTGKSHQGLSISRSGPAVFGVASVKDAQGTAGAFEMGLDVGPVLDALKARYGLDAAMFVEEKPLREIATGLGGEVLTDENRVGKYIRFHSTHIDRMRDLVMDRDLSDGEEHVYVRETGGVPYGVFLTPVKNFAGKPIGAIALAADFAGTRAAAGQTMVWQALVILFGCVIAAAVIVVVIRGVLLAPLDEVGKKLTALADGDQEATVQDAGDMCDELRAIAAAHERLRQQGMER